MLALPDVAELVGDEIVGGVVVPQEDRPPERVAPVPTKPGEAEEPRGDDDPHAVDLDGLRVPAERVETGLGALERGGAALGAQLGAGTRMITNPPSCCWTGLIW